MSSLKSLFQRFKISLQTILLVIVFPALLLFFQNCSPATFHNLISLNQDSHKDSGGNGEPYDGKPVHTRLVPGLTCSDSSVAVGSLDIHGSTATLITNENSCKNISTEISANELEHSSFTEKYVGYNDGVYTYVKDRNENIAKGIFTETWCRALESDSNQSTYEFVAIWQEDGHLSTLETMTQKNPIAEAALSSRKLDLDRVTYRAADDGALTVYFKQKVPGKNKVVGFYYGTIDGVENQKINLECLMGGQFDPIAPRFDFSGPSHKTIALGDSLNDLIPTVNKSTVKFSIDGTLPDGLTFNEKLGVISGTAKSLMARKAYNVSALFSFGKITKPISIAVADVQTVDQTSTLVTAITKANLMAPLPLIIKLNAPYFQLSGQRLEVSGDISIIGDAKTQSIIDANSLTGHFLVKPKARLEIQYLSLINGLNRVGGSIEVNEANLLVENSQFKNNSSDTQEQQGSGGAISATRSVTEIVSSIFTGNHTNMNGGGGGGAIYIESHISTTIKDSKFISNKGILGGAIESFAASNQSLEIYNSIFENNESFKGGAIYSLFGNLLTANSQFIKNRSYFDGGALHINMVDRAWILDSLFDGNVGDGFGSSAIYWAGVDWSGFRGYYSVMYIMSSKFINQRSQNTAGNVILNHLGQIIMGNSTVTENGNSKSCGILSPEAATYTALGKNVSSDGTCP